MENIERINVSFVVWDLKEKIRKKCKQELHLNLSQLLRILAMKYLNDEIKIQKKDRVYLFPER